MPNILKYVNINQKKKSKQELNKIDVNYSQLESSRALNLKRGAFSIQSLLLICSNITLYNLTIILKKCQQDLLIFRSKH